MAGRRARYGDRWDVRQLFNSRQSGLVVRKQRADDEQFSLRELKALGFPGRSFSSRKLLPEPKRAMYLGGSMGGPDHFGALSVAHVVTEIVTLKMARKLKQAGWKVDFAGFVESLRASKRLPSCAHDAARLILEHASTKGIPVRGPEGRSGLLRIERCGYVMKSDNGMLDLVSVAKALSSKQLGLGPVLLGVLTPGDNFDECTDEQPYHGRSSMNYAASRAVLCTGAAFSEEAEEKEQEEEDEEKEEEEDDDEEEEEEEEGSEGSLYVECYDHRPHGENGDEF